MSTKTLDKPVRPNDLILVYGLEETHMLVVTSAPEDQNSSTSSVIVRSVNWHVPDLKGYWVLDGPHVYYADDGEGADDECCLCAEHFIDDSEHRLDCFLDWLKRLHPEATQGFTVIVKPHGRDVLKHYFKMCCPNCGYDGWFCPGARCGPVDECFPGIRGHCGPDQACPMCMGYDFALNDKAWIAELDDLLDKPRRYKIRQEKMDGDEIDKIRDEVVKSARERYEAISARKQETGMPPEDFEQAVKDEESLVTE